jgi:nucleoside-diphosphate-sugar epimerase
MNQIQQEDIREFSVSFKLQDSLTGTRFLITGATGLIGSTLVHCLLALNRGIEITCPVRSLSKAKAMYGDEAEKIHFTECDLMTYLGGLKSNDRFQYIVHCASPTAGSYMIEHPVETFELAVESTRMLLDYARKAEVKGMVYVSSLEYYGQNNNNNIITEVFQGYVDAVSARSSYPMGKRAAEYLCTAYALEYGVPAKIARLTQTFGAGVAPDDSRVFAQFARSVMTGTDIVLHTTGESSKPYCYTTDCVSAILYILLKGQNGEAYNVSNDKTYITIRDMAELLRDRFNPSIKVVVESHPEMGYAPVTKLHLSAEKLKTLGWEPKYDLKEMFNRLIKSIS